MRVAFENGINFFDNAEAYGLKTGDAEIIMGASLKELGWNRSDYVISTKLFWGGAGENLRGLSRKHLLEGMVASLKRLQLEYVDIVFAHRPDPGTPMEEVVRGFTHIVNQGQALYWGSSEWTSQQITEAYWIARTYGLIPPVVGQDLFCLFFLFFFLIYFFFFLNPQLSSNIYIIYICIYLHRATRVQHVPS